MCYMDSERVQDRNLANEFRHAYWDNDISSDEL